MKKNIFLLIIFLLTPLIALANPTTVLAQNSIEKGNLPDLNASKKTEAQLILKTINLTTQDGSKNELVNTLLGTNKPVSLMFNEEENDKIEKAVDSFKSGQALVLDENDKDKTDGKEDKKTAQENEKSYVYLASILYYSPHDWTIWVNNTKINSAENNPKKELFVKAINQDSVKIRWAIGMSKWKILSGNNSDVMPKVNAENQVEVDFVLKPNQTFVLGSNNVVEGRAVPKRKTSIVRKVLKKLDKK